MMRECEVAGSYCADCKFNQTAEKNDTISFSL